MTLNNQTNQAPEGISLLLVVEPKRINAIIAERIATRPWRTLTIAATAKSGTCIVFSLLLSRLFNSRG